MTAGTARRAPTASACAVAVDVVLLAVRDGRLHVLLAEPDTPGLAGSWSLPGRRVRGDEDLPGTAHRALWELAGVTTPPAHLEQLRTYGEVSRDPGGRVVSVAHLAVTATGDDPSRGDAARFTAVDDVVSGRCLAYDHDRILTDALERTRAKLEYTSLATVFVTEPFTLGELRRVYEAVWGIPLDAANFRRKVVSTPGFVVEAAGLAPPGPGGGRPARRYRRGDARHLHPAMLRP